MISLMAHLRDIHFIHRVGIIDTGRKSSGGKTMREVFLDVIEPFSKYDLGSAEGTNKAIEEIKEKLGEVASFEARSVICPNRSCISRFVIACVSRLLSKILYKSWTLYGFILYKLSLYWHLEHSHKSICQGKITHSSRELC
jgi:hypothetical protein